jgi:hypothetical protein
MGAAPKYPRPEDEWVVRGARIRIEKPGFAVHDRTGVVLARTNYTARVRFDGTNDEEVLGLGVLRPESVW